MTRTIQSNGACAPNVLQPAQFAAEVTKLHNRYLEHEKLAAVAAQTQHQSDREGYVLRADMYLTIKAAGGPESPTVKGAIAAARIKGKSKNVYSGAVQLVEGDHIDAIKQFAARKKRRNLVDRRAILLAGLRMADEAGELDGLSAEGIGDWIVEKGGIDGVKAWMGLKAPKDESDYVTEVDLSAFRSAMTGAFEIPAPEEVNAAIPTISIHQRIEGAGSKPDSMMFLPLTGVPTSLLFQLERYLPAKDHTLVPDLRFWGHVATLCGMFDRKDSHEVMRPLDPTHQGSAKLGSGPIIRLLDGRRFRIAASRQASGLVVHINATVPLGLDGAIAEERHINVRGTNELIDKLAGPSARVQYDLGIEDRRKHGMFAGRIDEGGSVLSFKSQHASYPDFKVRVLPMSKFGSSPITRQWTLDIREDFAPRASATIDMASDVTRDSLLKFGARAASSKHPVAMKVAKGVLSLGLGQSNPITFQSSGEGTGSAELCADDFGNLIEAIGSMEASSCEWHLDPAGLVELRFSTAVANLSAFIPTAKNGVRSEKLLREIRRDSDVLPTVAPDDVILAAPSPVSDDLVSA